MNDIKTIKNKIMIIKEFSDYITNSYSTESDYVENIRMFINIMQSLEELESEVERLRHLEKDYDTFKFDSSCLKSLLEIIENSDNNKDILDKYYEIKKKLEKEFFIDFDNLPF